MQRHLVFQGFYRLRSDGDVRQVACSFILPVQGSLVKIFRHESAMISATMRHRAIQGNVYHEWLNVIQTVRRNTWICEEARLCSCIFIDTQNGREDSQDCISTHETNGEKQADIDAATRWVALFISESTVW